MKRADIICVNEKCNNLIQTVASKKSSGSECSAAVSDRSHPSCGRNKKQGGSHAEINSKGRRVLTGWR